MMTSKIAQFQLVLVQTPMEGKKSFFNVMNFDEFALSVAIIFNSASTVASTYERQTGFSIAVYR